MASPLPENRAFRVDLEAVIPALRAFARSLCWNRALADDLVQETLLKAWSARNSFREGRSLKSWTFTILHNVFHSEWRTSRWTIQLGEDKQVADAKALQNLDATLELGHVARVIRQLPVDQQEALTLIAAGGFTYEEAATIAGVAIGTMKSRVSRARKALQVRVPG